MNETHNLRRLCYMALPFVFAILLHLAQAPSNAYSQSMDIDEIRAVLNANPPATGNPSLREEALLSLDQYLNSPVAKNDPDVINFYSAQIESLADEIALPVPTGARIWQMYNHGYIVKTPSLTFSFDLINRLSPLPDEILQQIQLSFISHNHGDHSDGTVNNRFQELGVDIIRPRSLPLETEVVFEGLNVVAYKGLHGDNPNNIYHITTPEGLTIMHTGDTQHSICLPTRVPTDILLINQWMNESGVQPSAVGVRNGNYRVSPSLTILGHLAELNHSLGPDPTQRHPDEYRTALTYDDVPIQGELSVMAWGEVYEYNVIPEPSTILLAAFGLLGLTTCRLRSKRK
jgi:PEP-CTERM motif-containing protein